MRKCQSKEKEFDVQKPKLKPKLCVPKKVQKVSETPPIRFLKACKSKERDLSVEMLEEPSLVPKKFVKPFKFRERDPTPEPEEKPHVVSNKWVKSLKSIEAPDITK